MQITIVGLNLVGTSIALALKATGKEITITGHDPESDNLKRAKELKAIDKTHWNLISACDDAQVILLDLPLGETEKTIKALAPNIKPGALIMDTTVVKRQVMATAAKVLPEGLAFVGSHVVSHKLLASTAEPSADLLKDATVFLVAPDGIAAETINLATTLVEAVGATPRFIDAEEHDGLVAATFGLPMVEALTTFRTIADPAGLQERYKSMGAELYALGALLGATPEETAELIRTNADLVVPWLDRYTERLIEVRDVLAEGNREALQEIASQVHDSLRMFLLHGEVPQPSPYGDAGLGLRTMFLGGLGRKKPS